MLSAEREQLMLTESARTRAFLTIISLALVAALAAGAFSTGFFQALLFGAMAASAAILVTFFIVAVN